MSHSRRRKPPHAWKTAERPRQAVTALDEIQTETEEAAETDELVDQIEPIGEFTAVISDIADTLRG